MSGTISKVQLWIRRIRNQPPRADMLKETTCEAQVMSPALANNHLAANLHRLLAEEKGNVFFSPLSISTAMAMLLCAAEGETESEMRAALGHEHAGIKRDEVASAFQQQMSLLLKNPDSYTLSCANSMLSQKDLGVKDGYKQILSESFKALLLEVDFQLESQKAVNKINEWVKEKTNSMITELIQSFDPAAVIVLLNAVYFKGAWLTPFDESSTCPSDFYNGGRKDNAKKVDMMYELSKEIPYYEDNSFQALKLPYIGEEVAMLVVLPRKKNGLGKIESRLTPSFVQNLTGKLVERPVSVFLPKFRLEYTKSLIPSFQRLGISRLFSRGAELGVASDSSNLAVSEILHKAVLKVNEEGSVAAAVTIETMDHISCDVYQYSEFRADHPFLFAIYDTKSDLILFMGRVNEL